MNWTLSDLARIRAPLLAVLLAMLIASGISGLTRQRQQQALNQQTAARAAAAAAEERAATAVTDRANVQAYQAKLNHLRQAGVLGAEQRLPWVEYFTAQLQAGNPAELSLQIAPRRPLEDPPAGAEQLEHVQFFASQLSLEARLLHEGDALRTLSKLHEVKGAVILRQCSLRRSDGSTAARPYLLEMRCQGDLITLDRAQAMAENGS